MEKISVIIPIFNTDSKLLEFSVKSAIDQTYQNLEIILVDDGSNKESTIQKCSELELSDHRVKLLRQKNQGGSCARKTGIDFATGEWIVFLDSDDYLYKDACEHLRELITSGDYDFAEAAAIEVKNIETMPKIVEETYQVNILQGRETLMDAIVQGCFQPISWSLWGKIYKTDNLKQNYKIYYQIYRGEDVLALADYMAYATKTIHSSKIIYGYNKGNTDSVTTQKNTIRNLSMLDFWNKMHQLYDEYASVDSTRHVKGIYADCLAGCLLECKFYKCANYEMITKKISKELRKYYLDVFFNPYMPNRVKNIVAMILPKSFDFYWWLKKMLCKQ